MYGNFREWEEGLRTSSCFDGDSSRDPEVPKAIITMESVCSLENAHQCDFRWLGGVGENILAVYGRSKPSNFLFNKAKLGPTTSQRQN